MNNKRGQGLSTNAIILIVLGVVVLVILIAGFTIGWSSISSYLSSNNVNTIVKACSTACSTDDVYGYCSIDRKLVDAEKKEFTETCAEFSINADYEKYGIQACSAIDCPSVSEEEPAEG
ncbi:hypothetical protein BMS3Abin17_00537 [archaeon BMS3Abin17]|nr:hypothetical protein BMS3Abin17_00537 [archaeon BMS3Abin17]HDZ60445.1 hypothetical protein [Candidatus Pacearchaeota archaeon]